MWCIDWSTFWRNFVQYWRAKVLRYRSISIHPIISFKCRYFRCSHLQILIISPSSYDRFPFIVFSMFVILDGIARFFLLEPKKSKRQQEVINLIHFHIQSNPYLPLTGYYISGYVVLCITLGSGIGV